MIRIGVDFGGTKIEAVALDADGRFQARVVITSLAGDRTRSQRFLDLKVFDSEDAAVEHARESGMEWIDVNHHRQA